MKYFIAVISIFCSMLLYSFEVSVPNSSYNLLKNSGYDIINTDNSTFLDKPGYPMLPIKTIKIILPFGEKIKNVAANSSTELLENKFNIIPYSINVPTNTEPQKKIYKSSIYSKNQYYPERFYQIIGTQYKNGVAILLINTFPFQYNPITKKIKYNKNIQFILNTQTDNNLKEKELKFLLNSKKLVKLFDNTFYNKTALTSYETNISYQKSSKSSLVNTSNPYDYIIITNQSLETSWTSFISHKQSLGLNVNLYTTEDIYANYSGYDNAEKIRNFIIDAYSVWSATNHPLQWVLLGGDTSVIPSRLVKVYAYWSSTWNNRSFYSDNYYAGLDGDWDNDQDHIFGEGDDSQKPSDLTDTLGTNGEEADWFYEISVGRASLETNTEISNWINKTTSYENLNISSAEYLRTATMVGEYLGGGAYGADCMDEITRYLTDFDFSKLYQKYGTYSKQNVIDAINSGTNIVSHIGHGSYSKVCNIYDGDVDTLLTNTDYCLFYTQACYTGMMQLSCIAESFIEKEHGAYAYIGNSHYGFYSSYEQQGSSQLIEREFFDAIQNENIKNLGNANLDSKQDLYPAMGPASSLRFVGMDITLFGDPHLSLYTDVQNVTAEQTASNTLKITYSDTPGSGADNISNYSVYQRDDATSQISVSSLSISGNDVYLYLNSDLQEGIPYNLQISNVVGIKNPTIRPVKTLSNIIELSIITPTVWTSSNSPYYIYKNLIINGSNLKIEAGTTIKFNQDSYMIIFNNGWVKAIGDSSNKIVFTSYNDSTRANRGDWDEIYIYRDAFFDSIRFENCDISYATNGMVFDSLSTAYLSDIKISNCSEDGIYSYFANPTIKKTIITNCRNGLYLEHSDPAVSNIVCYQNDQYGIYLLDNSSLNLTNSIIWQNISGDFYNDNSILDVSYSDTQILYSGTGNISSNPLFTDTVNFFLDEFSPCIDSGNPASDFDPDNTIADMGAKYFYQPSHLDKPAISNITISDSLINLSWDKISGAIFYKVYSSQNPYTGFILETENLKSTTWTDTTNSDKKFYYISSGNNRN